MAQRKAKAYSYNRMSTLEQLKGDSKRRQYARAQRYALENNLEIVDRFDDWGVSAFRSRNAEFGALKSFKERVDAGDIERGSYLIVESMDRLSRDKVIKALTLLTEIVSKGIVLVTLDDNQVYSEDTIAQNSFSLIVALGSMSRAHEESRRKAGLISEVWSEKKRRARLSGSVATRKVPGWLVVSEGGAIEAVSSRADLVRQIFERTRDGWGAFSICRWLNERKEPVWSARKNAVWRESYIKKMLKSRSVLGEYQPHRITHDDSGMRRRTPEGDPILGYYPEVVSKELFVAANAATERRRIVGRGRKGPRYSNLFSGLLRCSCGAGYRYANKGEPPKGGKYLQCSVAFQRGSCGVRPIRYEFFEELLLTFLDSLDVERVLGGERYSERLTELRSQLGKLRDVSATLAVKIQRVVRAITDHDGQQSAALTLELASLERRAAQTSVDAERIERDIGEMTQVDPSERRAILDELLGKLRDASFVDRDVTRRALVGELQRMLEKVIVTPNVRVAWELIDEDKNWRDTYGVSSKEELEKLCRERSFDLLLVYRNGDTSAVDSMSGEYFRSKGELRVKDWNYLNRQSVDET